METNLHLQVSQHQASLKQENFTLSFQSYTTAKHFAATATFYFYTLQYQQFEVCKIRVSWNGELPLHQGFTTCCYCRPHYFYLYEVRRPMSSSYIYEIRLIGE